MSDTTTVSPLRQRMIEEWLRRKLNPHTQRSHIQSLQAGSPPGSTRSPDAATPDEVRLFQCTSWRAVRASATSIGL